MTTQLDLEFCADYLKLDADLKCKAHQVSLRIGAGRAIRERNASWLCIIHKDCLRYGSFEGMISYWVVEGLVFLHE